MMFHVKHSFFFLLVLINWKKLDIISREIILDGDSLIFLFLLLMMLFLRVIIILIFLGGVTISYLALYRKYRPDSFDKVFGQDYIVNTIKNAIINNRVSHAYLFSGPRGTGKTTIAKLIAKAVNCSSLVDGNPCDECDSCKLFNSKMNPDIIEIDAASNNGVDEIRAIRDKVSLMPTVSKYKVYIIDEVHMLSISAFNALLKTLEEPPSHVIFILATTEFYRIPETIISRCQCYDFERISVVDIVDCLRNISNKEKIDVSDEVLGLIANHCNGGLRDSISLLDKLSSCSDKIDKNLFYDVVGLVNEGIVKDLIVNICNGDINKVFSDVEMLEKNGKSVEMLVEQMLNYLKNAIVSGDDFVDKSKLMICLTEFNDISVNFRYSSNYLLSFEVGLLKLISKLNEKIISREIISDNSNDLKKNVDVAKTNGIKSEQMIEVKPVVKTDFSVVINNAFALADKKLKMEITSKWNGFYDYVHNKEFSSIVSYFLDGTLQVVGEKDVIISACYDSVVNNAVLNIAKLELLFNLVMGKYYNIAFVLDSEWEKLRDKYISDINSGKKYVYMDKKQEKDVIIEDDDSLSDSVISAQEIFGNDVVEIK